MSEYQTHITLTFMTNLSLEAARRQLYPLLESLSHRGFSIEAKSEGKNEVFDFQGQKGCLHFDVSRAKYLVALTPREICQVDVSELWPWLHQGIEVDWEAIKQAPERFDLTRPLIIAPRGDGTELVIDGWHRIARAMLWEIRDLTAVILTEEETAQVRTIKPS